ncbi:hypothetical protein ABPG72_022488 [Tetrahymena utriculariae]
METFGKILCGITSGLTLGIVNLDIEKETVVIKDPVTGISDLLKKGLDKGLRNKSEGVWIGTRPIDELGGFGVSSAPLRFLNLDVMHQAVMVDGRVFSLANDKGDTIKIKEVFSNKKIKKYEWKYRGKTKFDLDEIIEKANDFQVDYNLTFANCQDVSDALSKYALGIYSVQECLFFIFPKVNKIQEAIILGVFVGIGGKALARLGGDIKCAIDC